MPAKIPILGTGLSGLVGSKLDQLYAHKYSFDNFDITNIHRPIDITNAHQVESAINDSPAELMIHMAAFTDVTKAWEQSGDKQGLCYQVNVEGTQNIARACEKTGKHLVFISTAYIFDGQKSNPYLETDRPQPIEWYGQTKAEAEVIVSKLNSPWTILRIDQPFRSDELSRPDVVGRILSKLKDGSLPPQFTDHTLGPTYIDDLSKILDWVIRTKQTGIWHATSGESWTDFKFAQTIAKLSGIGLDSVKPGLLGEYLKTTHRPYQANTVLDSSKLIRQLDFELTPIVEALKQRLSEN